MLEAEEEGEVAVEEEEAKRWLLCFSLPRDSAREGEVEIVDVAVSSSFDENE